MAQSINRCAGIPQVNRFKRFYFCVNTTLTHRAGALGLPAQPVFLNNLTDSLSLFQGKT
jgi:hypothetical protein